MRAGDKVDIAGYTLEFRGTTTAPCPNYSELSGLLMVTRNGTPVTGLTPAKRSYETPRQTTTEAAIHVSWGGDLYVVLGDQQQDGSYAVRLYFNPLVRCIWLGTILMFLGGGLSLSDRRLRVGAPRRARAVVAAE